MPAAIDPLSLLLLAELRSVGERGADAVLRFARQQRLTLGATLALPASKLAGECGLGPRAIAQLTTGRATYLDHCRALLDVVESGGVSLSASDGPEYPDRWRARAVPIPPIAYWYGNRRVLNTPTVAVLNSRTITASAVSATIRLVQRLSTEECTVVTGSMKSTYRIAAVTARAAGTPRVIVLDRGLFAAFPHGLNRDPSGFGPRHSLLDPQRTLVLSPFRLHDHAAPHNGRRRDQLIAALADLVIAVNARPGGEIERVCLRALDAGQCVLSWLGENPGLVAAGARSIDDTDVEYGLRRLLTPRATDAGR